MPGDTDLEQICDCSAADALNFLFQVQLEHLEAVGGGL